MDSGDGRKLAEITTEAEFFWDKMQTKVLRVFLPCCSVTSKALPWNLYFFKLTQPLTYFFKLTQPLTYFFKLLQPLTYFYSLLQYTAKEKEGKTDRKTYPLSYDLRNPDWNLKSENSQDYAQKPEHSSMFMNSASGLMSLSCKVCCSARDWDGKDYLRIIPRVVW